MLERNTFAIQEHMKILSSVQSYDIHNGETGELVGIGEGEHRRSDADAALGR